jgi:hypothetical protein
VTTATIPLSTTTVGLVTVLVLGSEFHGKRIDSRQDSKCDDDDYDSVSLLFVKCTSLI